MTKPLTAAELLSELADDLEYTEARDRLAPHTNLAINVNRLRRQRNWTQAELARTAGMRQPRIAEIERGDANPRLDTIVKLAQALGVSAGSLLQDGVDRRSSTSITVRDRFSFSSPSELRLGNWHEVVVGSARDVAANDNFCLEA